MYSDEYLKNFVLAYNESMRNTTDNFKEMEENIDKISTHLVTVYGRLNILEEENRKLKADITEMKRQYNFHVHRDNLTPVFHSDRMEPCIDCLTKDK